MWMGKTTNHPRNLTNHKEWDFLLTEILKFGQECLTVNKNNLSMHCTKIFMDLWQFQFLGALFSYHRSRHIMILQNKM